MTSELKIRQSDSIFESIKHEDKQGEFWYARELGEALEYGTWDGFMPVITRARIAISKTGAPVENHFRDVSKMVSIGYGNPRAIDDIKLTRFACYIIAQNGSPVKKPKIAEAQAYFAIQTRKQEMSDQYRQDMDRLARRREFSESDKRLSSSVIEAGTSSRGLAMIKNEGDKSFFGGKTNKQMKKKLNTGNKPWANKAHNVVLAGKTLANEMTAANIENYGISSYGAVLHDNNDNNDAVRTTIRNQQGMNPEDFPAAEDTEKIQRRIKNQSTPKIDSPNL
ncbi:DNA damage-inducible protein D [Candidatus Saccharibacteria bacterium oral taxon 488]|nr:DNA damage-inducible protein D [Candidatus Saccharibacteria bacterium oral taxon 488]